VPQVVLNRWHALSTVSGREVEVKDGKRILRVTMVRVSKTGDAGKRPGPVDCTGQDGVSEAEVRRAQQAWAQCLRRHVEETVEIANGVTMTFVLVPPGKFHMGSPESEVGHEKDEALHTVVLTEPFYLGKYAVTQGQYEAVMKTNPSTLKGERLPVEQVSWEKAEKCCREFSRVTGQEVVLPTEAQWEYACRSGAKTAFHFGSSLNGDAANCNGDYPYGTEEKGAYKGKTVEVGSYPANAWGLYDMHGNVWQWCSDWYGPYASGSVTDPRGANGGSRRVGRGGSWDYFARGCRSAVRGRDDPSARSSRLGFRVALVPSGR
jgi:eukaryotic-like serine/threonine-protein kinase